MRRVAIVDAFSSGRWLPSMFREAGWLSTHVTSSPDLPTYLTSSSGASECDDHVEHDGSLMATVSHLKKLEVDYVLPGAESGVALAELLASALRLPGNDVTKPAARRDKWQMACEVSSSGLRTSNGTLARSPHEVLTWAEAHEPPFVVKPVASFGSDGVTVVPDAQSASAAARRLFACSDVFNASNDAVLVQSFLHGDEFEVNSTTMGGEHFITHGWRYAKEVVEGAVLYDHQDVVDLASAPLRDVVTYVDGCLTALGVTAGPAHTEVITTASGPVLVESAARLSGCVIPGIERLIFGVAHADLVVCAVTAPHELRRKVDKVNILQFGRVTYLKSPANVRLASARHWERVRSLPTCRRLAIRGAPGDVAPQTRDLISAPGFIYLVGPRSDVVRDHERIREMEASGFLYEAM